MSFQAQEHLVTEKTTVPVAIEKMRDQVVIKKGWEQRQLKKPVK